MSLNVLGLSKTEIRLQAKTLRQTLPIDAISHSICSTIAAHEAFSASREILAFYPLPHETDLRPLMAQHPEKHWFLPRIMAGNTLLFLRYRPNDDLFPNPFGVLEPSPNAEAWQPGNEKALLLVPGLVFDMRGHRLGYGKGYYDRFLAGAGPNVTRVGIVADALLVDGELPAEALDVAVNTVITDKRVVRLT